MKIIAAPVTAPTFLASPIRCSLPLNSTWVLVRSLPIARTPIAAYIVPPRFRNAPRGALLSTDWNTARQPLQAASQSGLITGAVESLPVELQTRHPAPGSDSPVLRPGAGHAASAIGGMPYLIQDLGVQFAVNGCARPGDRKGIGETGPATLTGDSTQAGAKPLVRQCTLNRPASSVQAHWGSNPDSEASR